MSGLQCDVIRVKRNEQIVLFVDVYLDAKLAKPVAILWSGGKAWICLRNPKEIFPLVSPSI